MNVKNSGSWEDHKDYYSNEDREMFKELLPTLVSESAMKFKFFQEEQKEMMDRFEREFGGAPLKIGGEE